MYPERSLPCTNPLPVRTLAFDRETRRTDRPGRTFSPQDRIRGETTLILTGHPVLANLSELLK